MKIGELNFLYLEIKKANNQNIKNCKDENIN
jgi:hypothetical protein